MKIRWMLCRVTDLSRLSCDAPLDLEETVDPPAQTTSCDLPVDADEWTVPPDLWADIDCPSDQTDLRLIRVAA